MKLHDDHFQLAGTPNFVVKMHVRSFFDHKEKWVWLHDRETVSPVDLCMRSIQVSTNS